MINEAVILVGGKGLRLGKITKKIPKPLIEINKKPFLDYLINFFIRFKIKKIFLITKYKHEMFHKKYHNKIINGTTIKCINQKKFFGTSGSIKKVINKLGDKFFLSNGDTIFDINLYDFQKRLKNNFVGILACSDSQKMLERYSLFKKKGKKIASSGIYLFRKNKINSHLICPGSLENEVIKKIPSYKFKRIIYKKKFLDIGTPNDLKKAKNFLNNFDKKKCAFLDRDGVINYDYGYVHKKNNFKWKKNVFKAIKFLNDNNYFVVVVTNQSGIGRGFYNCKDVENLHNWINKKLFSKGCLIDHFYYAPYYALSKKKKFRKDKKLRKPDIGMFERAQREINIDKKGSFLVGDSQNDREAARKFKIRYFNVDTKTDLYKLLKKKISC